MSRGSGRRRSVCEPGREPAATVKPKKWAWQLVGIDSLNKLPYRGSFFYKLCYRRETRCTLSIFVLFKSGQKNLE